VLALAFLVGAWICLFNFYLSFVRYPIHRLRGGSVEDFEWTSGIPMLGSLLVATAWLPWTRGGASAACHVASCALMLCDTCGPLWFFCVTAVMAWRRRGRTSRVRTNREMG